MMVRGGDLFSFGLWTDRLPILDQVDAGYGHDSRHKEHMQVLSELSTIQSAQLQELRSLENVSRCAIAEAEYQHRSFVQSLKNMTFDIVGSLNCIEEMLGGHLEGIRATLGNICGYSNRNCILWNIPI